MANEVELAAYVKSVMDAYIDTLPEPKGDNIDRDELYLALLGTVYKFYDNTSGVGKADLLDVKDILCETLSVNGESVLPEVGTFTPTLTGTSSGWTATGFSSTDFNYIKIGRMVTVNGKLIFSGVSGNWVQGNYFSILGLPYDAIQLGAFGPLNNLIGQIQIYGGLSTNLNATGFCNYRDNSSIGVYCFLQTVVGAVTRLANVYVNFNYITT